MISEPHESRVEILSPPVAVSMADSWFEIATPDHFWMVARFRVLRWLAQRHLAECPTIAEVGCGNGALQRQIELAFGRSPVGMDLNLGALEQSCSNSSRLLCYDITERRSDLAGAFGLILLCDVLEHIDKAGDFMSSLAHHLAADGLVLLNVPARPELYSTYDRMAGHVRRYTMKTLDQELRSAGFEITKATYWGLGFYPVLAARKWWLASVPDEKTVIERGFKPSGRFVETVMKLLAHIDPRPNRVVGTSIAALARRIR